MSNTAKDLKITYLGSENLQISELENKRCNFYTLQTTSEESASVNHHILLLDVSGSMYGELEDLKNRTKLTLEALRRGKNNYVSIIIYSGHNESYRLINAAKCDMLSYKMARVFEILDEELYTRGVTVMSEPLEQAIEIVKQLGDVCNKHHIALFTDGCLVTYKWSVQEEEARVLKIANICKEQGIFFNAIGFGQYYDRNFLKKIIENANTGNLYHIDAIKDYYKTMVNLTQEINHKDILDLEIDNTDYFILNTSKRLKGKDHLRTFSQDGLVTLVVFDEPLVINEQKIPLSKSKKLEEHVKEDCLYTLALYHVIHEDIESAEIALAQTGDLNAYTALNNCYSFVEKGKAINNLSIYISSPEKRFQKGKATIKVAAVEDEPICLLEVLQEILMDPDSQLLWDYSYKYKRIGTKTQPIEDQYQFIRPKVGYGEVVDLSIGSKKLNIGVKVKINGQILDTESKLKLDGHIFRDYNLVVNGNINTDLMWCKLSKKLKQKFRKEKLIKSVTKLYGEEIITLNLRKLKSTNKRLLKSLNIETIVEDLYQVETLKCKQWALKQLIKELGTKEDELLQTLPEQQISIRSKYRVDEDGLYHPISTKTACEELPYEIYPAKVLEWKIEKFPRKKTQEQALLDYNNLIDDNKESAVQRLRTELYTVKEEKHLLTYKINLVRLSCGLSGKNIFLWEKELEKDKTETDKVLNMNTIVGEKVTIATKTLNTITIRQDTYTVLTRCN